MKRLIFLIIPLGFIIGCANHNPIKKLDCIVSQSYGNTKINKGDKALNGYYINTDTGSVYEENNISGKLKPLNGLTKDDLLDYETNSSINNGIWKMEMILTSRFDKADAPYKLTGELDLNTLSFKEKGFTYESVWEEDIYNDGYCKLIPTSLTVEKSIQ